MVGGVLRGRSQATVRVVDTLEIVYTCSYMVTQYEH